mmetsp:Transcript_58206/g.153059  ORF Transcript_58206/g.153059 Transcript_58206/m.153059 type:complete len:86 (-) Transcript_58206:4098-4355(-)
MVTLAEPELARLVGISTLTDPGSAENIVETVPDREPTVSLRGLLENSELAIEHLVEVSESHDVRSDDVLPILETSVAKNCAKPEP